MLGEEEKDTETKEEIIEVKENKSEPLSPLESRQAAIEADANVAEDQELKVLPESEDEKEKEIIVAADAARKSLPRATTTTSDINKRKKQKQLQKQLHQQKEPTITNVSKQLEQQTTEIKNMKSILQPQLELIKPLQSQFKQLQKQMSQIQKYVAKKKKKKNK
jgi:hypothetical protein